MPTRTIDDVLDDLDRVIERAAAERSRLGFFAVLYHGVTVAVRDGIAEGRFEDGGRMERLDVCFADRYLDALAAHRAGRRTSRCWQTAFAAADRWRPLILQHLLLGMNAHINLDLGVAAAQTAPGADLEALRADFDAINNVLAALLDGVQDRMATVSPWMGWLDRFACNHDEYLGNFGIQVARRFAWRTAEKLAALPEERHAAEIDRLDAVVTLLAHPILKPGPLTTLAMLAIRLHERSDVPEVIEALRHQVAVMNLTV